MTTSSLVRGLSHAPDTDAVGAQAPAARPGGWISPRTGVRFEVVNGQLTAFGRDGRPFLIPTDYADAERQRADAEARRAAEAQDRADKLAAKLRELGLDPDAV